MSRPPRPYVLHEASYRQLLDLRPTLAVLPWGATEAHNYHLPFGTDTIEAVALGEAAVAAANAQGARCVLLPAVPFGNNNQQLPQVATITMRTSTQALVLRDVAESLVRQGIDRLVVLNFHGGNEFKQLIRDVMFDLPIFVVQVHGWMTNPRIRDVLEVKDGTHADEMETSLLLHLTPEWVSMADADDGRPERFELPRTLGTPGITPLFDWPSMSRSSGVGDPRHSTAEKGRRILEMLAEALAPALVELAAAKPGQLPFVIRPKSWRFADRVSDAPRP